MMPTPTISRSERQQIERQVKDIAKLSKNQQKALSDTIESIVANNQNDINFSSRLSERLQREIMQIINESKALADEHVSQSNVPAYVSIPPKDKEKNNKLLFLLAGAVALGLTSFVSRSVMSRTIVGKEASPKVVLAEATNQIKIAISEVILTTYNVIVTTVAKHTELYMLWNVRFCVGTCDQCASMDGKIAKSFSKLPKLHRNCRCFISLVSKPTNNNTDS